VPNGNLSREMPVLVVVDEAYYEYAKVFALDYPDTLSMQKNFRTSCLRTFSKAHALAVCVSVTALPTPILSVTLDRVRHRLTSAPWLRLARKPAKDAARIQKR